MKNNYIIADYIICRNNQPVMLEETEYQKRYAENDFRKTFFELYKSGVLEKISEYYRVDTRDKDDYVLISFAVKSEELAKYTGLPDYTLDFCECTGCTAFTNTLETSREMRTGRHEMFMEIPSLWCLDLEQATEINELAQTDEMKAGIKALKLHADLWKK